MAMATGIPHGTIPGTGGPGDMTGPPPEGPGGWTPGRVVAVVLGSLLALVSVGLFVGGGIALWADQGHRQAGDISTGTVTYSTTGYALASDRVSLSGGLLLTGLVGDVRLRVTPADPGKQVFVAIGPADRVAAYLAGVRYTAVTGLGSGSRSLESHLGSARPAPPRTSGIWVSEVSGSGTQTLLWTAKSGDWMAVAMNPDGSAGLTANAGVSAPGLFRLAVDTIIGGAIAGVAAAALIVVPVRMAAGVR
jgi:FAD/FMN-containing dehydrogenase